MTLRQADPQRRREIRVLRALIYRDPSEHAVAERADEAEESQAAPEKSAGERNESIASAGRWQPRLLPGPQVAVLDCLARDIDRG